MAFPKRLLHSGEEVFVDQRPHPLRLFYPTTVSLVITGGLGVAFVAWRSAPTWFGIVLGVAFLAVAGYFFSRFSRWRATSFVVTSHRVVYRSGVLRRRGREIPIDAVQSVSYRQSLPGRLVRLGTVCITSAGEGDEQEVPDIRDPERVQSAVHAAIEAGVQRRYGAIRVGAAAPAPLAAPLEPATLAQTARDVGTELSRLELLYARGVITDDELELARGELLAHGDEGALA